MKNIKYKSFSSFFNLFKRLFKTKNNNVTFITVHKGNLKDNLGFVYAELSKRNSNFNYTFISKEEYSFSEISSLASFLHKIIEIFRLFLFKSYKMATSRYILLNDNFLPMAYMNFNSKDVVIQLWHGAGAFKKFGLSSTSNQDLIELQQLISKKLDHIIVSSKNVAPFYEEAFGVDSEKILALGIPSTDYYFKKHDLNELRVKFEDKYPKAKNKKIVLYAPTFRENEKMDENLIENFDIELFNNELGSEYILCIRLHPQINNASLNEENVINLTDYPDEKELLLLADILITDYSSIMVEYTLLNKPLIFYPYDYEYYLDSERGFYFNYKNIVPGPVARTNKELINIIKEDNYDFKKINDFKTYQFDHADGNSSKRVVDLLYANK